MSQCRFCYEEINSHARRCPKCHADLSFLGRLAGLRTLASVLAAMGGLGFGVYEKLQAMEASRELEQEQAALMQVLDNVPETELTEKFGEPKKDENQLKADLKKNPKNVDARIRLRMLQHRKHAKFQRGTKSNNVPRTASRTGTPRGKSRRTW